MKIVHEKIALRLHESLICRTFDLPVFDCPYHRHDEFEILRIDESQGRVMAGDFVGRFAPGQVYVFGHRLPHAFINHAGTKRARSRCIQFNTALMSESLSRIPEGRTVNAAMQRARRGLLLLGDAAVHASHAVEHIMASSGMMRIIELLRFLTWLEKVEACKELASEGYDPKFPDRHFSRLEQTLATIHEHSASNLTIPDLAEQANMSVSAFHRHFRHYLGCTPGDYILDVRLAVVARGLLETDETIAQLAFAAGFNNLSNFNRRFQKRFRCTPRQYRLNRTL